MATTSTRNLLLAEFALRLPPARADKVLPARVDQAEAALLAALMDGSTGVLPEALHQASLTVAGYAEPAAFFESWTHYSAGTPRADTPRWTISDGRVQVRAAGSVATAACVLRDAVFIPYVDGPDVATLTTLDDTLIQDLLSLMVGGYQASLGGQEQGEAT